MNNIENENYSVQPEKEKSHLSRFIASSDEPIIRFTSDFKIIDWNPAAESVFGYKKEEAIGSPISILVPRDQYPGLKVLCEKVVMGIPVAGCETRGLKKSGEAVYIRFSFSASSENDEDILVTAVVEDLTRQHDFQELLAREEERYRTLVNLVSNMVWVADSSGSIIEEASGWEEFTGQKPEEYLGWGWARALHPDDTGPTLSNWKRSLELGAELNNEFRLRTKTGEYRRVLARGIPLKNSAGNVRLWIGLITDIEDRRQAEDNLRKSETKFRTLITQVKDYAIFSADPGGVIQTWNEGVYQVLGYREKEFIGLDSAALFTDKAVRKGVPGMELRIAAEKGTASNDRWMKRKDNKEVWIAGRVSSIRDNDGNLIGFTKVMRDQTKWKVTAEERNLLLVQVQRHSKKLQALAQASLRFSKAQTLEETFQLITDEAMQIIRARRCLTCTTEDFLKGMCFTSGGSLNTKKACEILQKTTLCQEIEKGTPMRLSKAQTKSHPIFEKLKKEGLHEAWMQGILCTTLNRKDGKVIGYMLLFNKIHGEFTEEDSYMLVQLAQHASASAEQAQTKHVLSESEQRFRMTADKAPVFMWMTDENGKHFWFNKVWLDFTGKKNESAYHIQWRELIHPDDYPDYTKAFSTALKGRTEFKVRYRLKRHDGKYRWLLDNGVPRYQTDGTFLGFIGSCVDITEIEAAESALKNYNVTLENAVKERTKELEQSHKRLQFSERMASIGTLSAGLGHDMGNLLLPVRIRLERLNSLDLPEKANQDLAVIRTSAEYLQRLSNGLRLLAMDPSRARHDEKTDIHGWWEDVSGVLVNALPRGVSLKVKLPQEDCMVSLSRTSLTQVVFNLVQNSGDAITEKKDGEVEVLFDDNLDPDYLTIYVKDNGPGMSHGVAKRAMEPFFTTKTRGVSTGLGLALVYGLVADAGGETHIESEKDRGTTVSVKIPKFSISEGESIKNKKALALLDIKDPRISSFIANELAALDCEVTARFSKSNPPDLYIIDTERISREPQLLSDNGSLPTVIYGNLGLDGEIPEHVEVLGAKPRLQKLRGAIRTAIEKSVRE